MTSSPSQITSSPSPLTSLHSLLRLLLLFPILLLGNRRRRRLVSLVTFQDLLLHLHFLRHHLTPSFIPISPSTTIHLFTSVSGDLRRRRRPPLLLLHGFGANAKWQWHRQLPSLSRSFDLYIPDLLHFGRSHSSGPENSLHFQARCIAEAMRRIGVERYGVVGISYGGFVAFRMAAEDSEAVERVVVLTAGVAATEEERREMRESEGRDVAEILLPENAEDLMTLMRRSMFRPPKWMPEFLLQDFVEVMYKDRRKERVELLKELLESGTGMDPLPVLKQESLLIWGDKDDVFPLKYAHQLHRHLGEKSRLEIVKDAGHALQLEKPDEVNHLIEKFMLISSRDKLT